MSVILHGAAKGIDFGGQVVNGLANAPVSLGVMASCAGNTVTGIVETALSCLTGGYVKRFNQSASRTRAASLILPTAYRSVIGCFNEKAFKPVDTSFPDLGYCRQNFNLFSKAFEYHDRVTAPGAAPTFLQKHFATRGYYFIAAVVAVITRVADFILGSFAAIASLACVGQWDKANEFAAKNLTILGIIDDLSRGIRGVFNPGQSHLKLTSLTPPPAQGTPPPAGGTPPPAGGTLPPASGTTLKRRNSL